MQKLQKIITIPLLFSCFFFSGCEEINNLFSSSGENFIVIENDEKRNEPRNELKNEAKETVTDEGKENRKVIDEIITEINDEKILEKRERKKIIKNCSLFETEKICKENSQNIKKVTALFFGDMMLDRYIRQKMDANGWEYILDESIKKFMNTSDITLVNFEGAMTENNPYPAHDMMLSFTSDPKWAKKMKEYGITIAGLANNHSLNFGKQGLKDTRKFLLEADINTFGEPFNTENISFIQDIKGMKIGFIGYHELFDGNIFPIVEEIKTLKEKTDFIIIYAHWGDEYKQQIHPRPQKKARTFIDEGADIVIGHHPHVVQPMEIYNGKYIFYSLGNFVFDQKAAKSVKTRLGLEIIFECNNKCVTDEDKKISYTLFPLISNNEYQVRLMNSEEKNDFLEWFKKISQ